MDGGSRTTFRAQQEVLDNIQHMLVQLLTNRNNNDNGSNHNGDEHNDDLRLRSRKKVLQLMLRLLKAFRLRLHP